MKKQQEILELLFGKKWWEIIFAKKKNYCKSDKILSSLYFLLNTLYK